MYGRNEAVELIQEEVDPREVYEDGRQSEL